MILVYVEKLKIIPKNTIELIVERLSNNTHSFPKCPKCKTNKHFRTHCIYERKICTIENKKIISKPILVQRLYCTGCDKTHALLPDDVIPYSHYGKKVIIYCLYEYYINKKTLSKISEKTKICLKLIYRFKKLYLAEYLSLLIFMKSQIVNEYFPTEKYIAKYLHSVESLGQFLLDYFKNTKKVIFLKKRLNIITNEVLIGYSKCKNTPIT